MGGEAEVVTTMGERGIEQQSEDHREVNKQGKRAKRDYSCLKTILKKSQPTKASGGNNN